MKKTLTFILLTVATFAFGQTEISTKYHTADSLLQADNLSRPEMSLHSKSVNYAKN